MSFGISLVPRFKIPRLPFFAFFLRKFGNVVSSDFIARYKQWNWVVSVEYASISLCASTQRIHELYIQHT